MVNSYNYQCVLTSGSSFDELIAESPSPVPKYKVPEIMFSGNWTLRLLPSLHLVMCTEFRFDLTININYT